MKLFVSLLPSLTLAANGAGPGGLAITASKQTCADEPCKNGGACNEFKGKFTCDCSKTGFSGMFCDVEQPKIVCGDSYMSVTMDKKMITEHGFKDDIDNLKFQGDGDNCLKEDTGDSFVMTIKSPFSGCGTTTTNDDDGDFKFKNAVSWKQLRRGLPGETPVVQEIKLIEFICEYEDQYAVHAEGGITPAISTVDAKTGLGDFTVELGLYKDQSFLKPYSENPVVKISNDVCVQLELKNNIREDVVLSANECWASSKPNGQGDRHELLLNKCANPDDPSLKVVQNGHSRFVQLCFEMFKWEADMDQVYLNCNVNVCQSGGENINDCICQGTHDYDEYYYANYYYANYMAQLYEDWAGDEEGSRKKRAAGGRVVRAAAEIKKEDIIGNEDKDDISESIETSISWTVTEPLSPEEIVKMSEVSRSEFSVTPDEEIETIIQEIKEEDEKITMIISIALVVAMVALGVCIGVYVQCRRKYSVQRQKIREIRKVKEFYNGVLKPYNHSSHLPEQGSEQLPTQISN